MKKITSLFLFTLIYVNSVAQVFPTTDSTWAESSPVIDYAREVINTLCDPKMNGRGVVKGGDQLAADYILTEFRSIGVTPIGNSYFQKFPVNANTFPNKMDLLFDKDKTSLQAGIDFWVEPNCPSIIGSYKLIYIDRKMLNDRMVLLDKLRDAKEGFILIDNENKTGESPETTKKIDALIQKIKTDMQVQLKGVMIYDKVNLSWASSNIQSARPVIYVVKDMDISKVKTAKVEIEAEYKTTYQTQNVVGIIEGSLFPDSAIIISAHYDHLGMMGANVIFPGANSNASGVAMMLNLAKHFEMIKPKYSIIFIALGAEELGLEGSKAYTNFPALPLSKTKFLLNFDVIGTGVDGAVVVNGSLLEANYKMLNDINNRDKYIKNLKPRGEACISGHCIFQKAGVPSFSFYAVGGDIYYHKLEDTPENTPLTAFESMFNIIIKYIERIK